MAPMRKTDGPTPACRSTHRKTRGIPDEAQTSLTLVDNRNMEPSVKTKRRKAAAAAAPYHHGDLRNELVRQGRQFLETAGPGEISLAELARRAGVSDAAPFKHFESKESLLAAIAAQGMQELVDGQIAIAALDVSNVERVRAMMLNYVAYGRNNPGIFNLMIGPRIAELSRYPELQVIGSRSFQLFLGAIRAFATERGWAPGEVELLTHAAWATQHGLATLVLARRAPHRTSTVEPEEMVQFVIAMTLTSIAAGPAGSAAAVSGNQKAPARRKAA